MDQAPARVSHAASEYVQALGLRPTEPPLSAEAIGIGREGGGSGQASAFLWFGCGIRRGVTAAAGVFL